VSLPCIFARRHHPRAAVVVELGVLPQAAPQTELLAGIVALVYQVVLVGEGVVLLDEGLDGAVPGLLLEGAALAQVEVGRLDEGAEEGGLVGRGPAEARSAVLAGGVVGRVGAAGGRVVLVRHLGRQLEANASPTSGNHPRRQRRRRNVDSGRCGEGEAIAMEGRSSERWSQKRRRDWTRQRASAGPSRFPSTRSPVAMGSQPQCKTRNYRKRTRNATTSHLHVGC